MGAGPSTAVKCCKRIPITALYRAAVAEVSTGLAKWHVLFEIHQVLGSRCGSRMRATRGMVAGCGSSRLAANVPRTALRNVGSREGDQGTGGADVRG
jgi:hypothetical protein